MFSSIAYAQNAQENRDFEIQRYVPALTSEGILDVQGARAPKQSYGFNAVGNYNINPLIVQRVNSSESKALVQYRAETQLQAWWKINDRFLIAAELPTIDAQGRNNGTGNGVTLPLKSLTSAGIGNPRLALQVFLFNHQQIGVDLGIQLGTALPLGTKDAYMADQKNRFFADLLLGRKYQSLRWGLNLGYHQRSDISVQSLVLADELTFKFGLGWRSTDTQSAWSKYETELALSGATNIGKPFNRFNQNYLEALAGFSRWCGDVVKTQVFLGTGFLEAYGSPDLRFGLAIRYEDKPTPDLDKDKDGILDAVDQCIDDPEDKDQFEDENGCPDPDNDKDGILDVNDQCKNDPEDKDQFEDENGCPDPDNDKDGILDVNDQCKNDPEDKDQFEDENGCPDPDNDQDTVLDVDDACINVKGDPTNKGCPKEEVKEEKIDLIDKIYFANNSDVILQKSFKVVDHVAEILKNKPNINVRIEGHTDNQGSDESNQNLSDRRCISVMNYLINKGIAKERLTTKGYGESKPIDTNDTPAGREMNRRVEFIIVK